MRGIETSGSGDFAVLSNRYLSVYSINCVLLAVHRTEEEKFTSLLIFQVKCPRKIEK